MHTANQRDIFVCLHLLSLPFPHRVSLYILLFDDDDVIKKHVEPIIAPPVCPYKPFHAFSGGGFDHHPPPPPNFRISQS